MNIYTMNLRDMADKAVKATATPKKGEARPSKYLPIEITNPTVFLQQALVIFAHCHPVKSDALYSMSDTINALPDEIVTDNGYVTKENFKGLLVLLYNLPRSFFVKKMGQNPTLGSFTPLFLYAHKLYNDINYDEWAKDDPMIQFALGIFLFSAIDTAPLSRITLSAKELVELRTTALTYQSGAKAGTMEKVTGFKMPMRLSLAEGVVLHKQTSFMLLQTWICNATVRNVKSMILDPWDWDNIPDAIDAVPEPVSVVPTDPGRSEYRSRDLH